MTDIEGLVTLGKDYNSRPEEREFQTFLTVHCHYWRRIGLNLRLKPTVLDVVAADHVTVRERFRVVLCNWLLLQGDNATWHHLEIAITNARREELGLNPLTNRAVETVLESQSIQPVAVVDTHADDGVDDLLSNVKPKSIQELEVKFAKVTNRIKQQVFNHPRINPMSLIEQLRTVSAVRDQHVPLLDEDVFTRVTTMEQLWRKLTNYWTIYNYDILKILVDITECKQAITTLKTFSTRIDLSTLTKEHDLVLCSQVFNRKWLVKPVLRIKVGVRVCSRYIERKVKEMMCQKFNLEEYSLHLKGIQDGCFELFYEISVSTMSYLLQCKFTGHDLAEFKTNKVMILELQSAGLEISIPAKITDMDEVFVWSVKGTLENNNKDSLPCGNRCGLGTTSQRDYSHNKTKSNSRANCNAMTTQTVQVTVFGKSRSMNGIHKLKTQLLLAAVLLLCCILWIPTREINISQLNQQIKNFQDYIHNHEVTSWSNTLNQSSELSSHGNQVAPVVLKMSNFTGKLKNKEVWYSEPFFAFERGYKMSLIVHAAGNGKGERTHMSIFLYLMKGPYDDDLEQSGHFPLRGTCTIELLNQLSDMNHHSLDIVINDSPTDLCKDAYKRVTNGLWATTSCGYPTFIQHQEVTANDSSDISYIKDENLYFGIRYNDDQRTSYSKEVSRMTKQFSQQHASLQEDMWSQILIQSSELSSHGNQVAPVILKMSAFTVKMRNKESWCSEPFFTFEGGHKMSMIVYPAGAQDREGAYISISVGVVLMKGPYDDDLEQSGHFPLRGTFTIELLNQMKDDKHYSDNVLFDTIDFSNRVVAGDRHYYGRETFMFLFSDDMLHGKYLKTDNVYFRVKYNS